MIEEKHDKNAACNYTMIFMPSLIVSKNATGFNDDDM